MSKVTKGFRLSKEADAALDQLAAISGKTRTAVLEWLVEREYRKRVDLGQFSPLEDIYDLFGMGKAFQLGEASVGGDRRASDTINRLNAGMPSLGHAIQSGPMQFDKVTQMVAASMNMKLQSNIVRKTHQELEKALETLTPKEAARYASAMEMLAESLPAAESEESLKKD